MIKIKKLNNDAVLIYKKNDINSITSARVYFDCGSRCDTIPGLAHFTEHMFFTGTDKLNKEEVSKKYYDFIKVNAFTNLRSICFTGEVFTKEFKDYISTVATLINDSKFDQIAVDKEKKVVQQEIAMCEDDFKYKSAFYNLYNLYNEKTFKNTVLGSKESVGKIKSKDVKNFVNKYFVANNAFVTVTSPYSLSKIKKIVNKELINKLKVDNNFKTIPYFSFKIKNDNFIKVQNKEIDKCYMYLNFVFDNSVYDFLYNNKLFLIIDIMNDISDGIIKKIRFEKSLVYGGYFTFEFTENKTILSFETECDKHNINDLLIEIANYLQKIYKEGFSSSQLDKINRQYDHNLKSKTPSLHRFINISMQYKRFGKILNKKKLNEDRLNTKVETLNEIIKDILSKSKVSMSLYGNITSKEIMSKQKFDNLFTF